MALGLLYPADVIAGAAIRAGFAKTGLTFI
jgi:hypothetical protein